MKYLTSSVCLMAAISLPAGGAAVLSQLDQRYLARSLKTSPAEFTALAAEYGKIARDGDASPEDRLHAAVQAGRLNIIVGTLLPATPEGKTISLDAQKKALDHCRETVAAVMTPQGSARKIPAASLYIWLSCTAARGKLETTVLGRATYAVAIKAREAELLASAATPEGQFEGGGIYRVLSAIRANPASRALGMYNPNQAVAFVAKALSSTAVASRPFKNAMRGIEYRENDMYLAKARTSVALEKNDLNAITAAATELGQKMTQFEKELKSNPSEREFEGRLVIAMSRSFVANVQQCSEQKEWQKCLLQGM